MLKLRCRKHPRYSGLISPKASCQACIELYSIRQKAYENRLEVLDSSLSSSSQKSKERSEEENE